MTNNYQTQLLNSCEKECEELRGDNGKLKAALKVYADEGDSVISIVFFV